MGRGNSRGNFNNKDRMNKNFGDRRTQFKSKPNKNGQNFKQSHRADNSYKGNPFRQNSGQSNSSNNPSGSLPVAEQSTPWLTLKNQFAETQKKFEINYNPQPKKSNDPKERKAQIESKRNEPTKWESFTDGCSTTKKKTEEPAEKKGNIYSRESAPAPHLPKKVNSKDFDCMKLTAYHKNHFRKVITKCARQANVGTLKMALNEMKWTVKKNEWIQKAEADKQTKKSYKKKRYNAE